MDHEKAKELHASLVFDGLVKIFGESADKEKLKTISKQTVRLCELRYSEDESEEIDDEIDKLIGILANTNFELAIENNLDIKSIFLLQSNIGELLEDTYDEVSEIVYAEAAIAKKVGKTLH